ncbi:MAG: polysulfide reductase NrfD, partial [Candidatus Omnitrophica bacterium]|nr:polysulfide reductase NrfD [Candidatus Omnitrophota bacterium]
MATTAVQEIDNTSNDPTKRPTLVTGGLDFNGVTETVCRVAEAPSAPKSWYFLLVIAVAALLNLFVWVGYLITTGTGVWGLNNPVGWGWAIVNFVFWVGIGHAGTLISAILFLFRQKWRTSINRFAEAMTIFAVMCAGLFPGIHVGRVWVVYWMFPIPNYLNMWPQFR